MDIKSVWGAMEECQPIGLTKSIGVSNFSYKKIGDLLAFAKIAPAVNQVSSSHIYARAHTHTHIYIYTYEIYGKWKSFLNVERWS